MIRNFYIASLVIFISGCASPIIIKDYNENINISADKVLITCIEGTDIRTIDGIDVERFKQGNIWNDCFISLRPGRHTIVARYHLYTGYGKTYSSYLDYNINADAGSVYKFKLVPTKDKILFKLLELEGYDSEFEKIRASRAIKSGGITQLTLPKSSTPQVDFGSFINQPTKEQSIPRISLLSLVKEDKELSGDEIKGLYNDRTAIGYHKRLKYSIKRYFAPNGMLLSYDNKYGKRIGKWWVKNNKLCIVLKKGVTYCNKIHSKDMAIVKVKDTRKENDAVMIKYNKFIDGNDFEKKANKPKEIAL